jgi:hypothetical protein
MVVIHFEDGSEWFKANWVFRQFLEDVADASPEDAELRFSMEQADALGGLFLDSLEPLLASKLLRAMKAVAEGTIGGRIQGWSRTKPHDEDGQRMYLEALAELLAVIKRQPSES